MKKQFFNLNLNFISVLSLILPIKSYYIFKNEISILCSPIWVYFTSYFLKTSLLFQCKLLTSITAVDYLDRSTRFEIIYDFLSIYWNFRLRLKTYSTELGASYSIDSLSNLFLAASWYEREIWDLFGIYFNFNNDLRRLLTDYGFLGFPLRKDFPVSGFVEIQYNFLKRSCCYELLELDKRIK